jgi:aminopeptidase
METKEVVSWLTKTGLISKTKEAVPCCERILKDCLNVKSKEDILIVGDYGCQNYNISSILSGAYLLAAKRLKIDANIVMQSPKLKGEDCDSKVVYALADLPEKSVAIINTSGKLGGLKYLGKSFRAFSTQKKHRFCSSSNLGMITNLDYHKALNCLDIDYNELRRKGNALKDVLDKSKHLQIMTDNGTDFQASIYGKKALVNHAEFREAGEGGNIPAGEVYIAPKAKHKNFGTIVIDGSLSTREGTYLLKDPVKLRIEKSEVVEITGGRGAELLERTLQWADENSSSTWGNRRIAEIGIGINPRAQILGVTVIDEKTLGTAHVGIGSNAWFGGTIYAKLHLDQVFRGAKILADGKLIDVSKI